jgi:hypothetical protein
MKRTAKRAALGSDMLASHPVDLYATPAPGVQPRAAAATSASRPNGAAARATQRHGGRRRPQLNALLESWEDVARFRAVAYVRRADLREVLIPALKLYVKALTPAERRAIDVETKRIAATLATSD